MFNAADRNLTLCKLKKIQISTKPYFSEILDKKRTIKFNQSTICHFEVAKLKTF